MAFMRADRNPLKRSGQDTTALVLLAATILFPPLFLAGIVLVWLSDYWTRNEKLFATLLPLGLAMAGWLYGFGHGGFVVPIAATYIAGMLSALVVSFTLAFRSGLRDSRVAKTA